jgi:hypothetical protein
MRQIRINTQNMIVLTLEFTRRPLSRRRRGHSPDLHHRFPHLLDACPLLEVTERHASGHKPAAALGSRY